MKLKKGYRMLQWYSKCRIQIRIQRPNEKFTNAISEQWEKCTRTMHIVGGSLFSNSVSGRDDDDGGGGGQSSPTKNNT